MNTENIAHEKRYRDWWAQYDAMFAPENRSPQQDEQFPLTDGYSICSKAYIYDGDLHLCGSESELLDNEGKVKYVGPVDKIKIWTGEKVSSPYFWS